MGQFGNMTAAPRVNDVASALAESERRFGRRYTVARAVAVAVADGRAVSARVIEVSASGCRLAGLADGALAAGAAVSIDLGHGAQLVGTVRWAEMGYAGVVQPAPLDDAALKARVAACRTRRPPAIIARQ